MGETINLADANRKKKEVLAKKKAFEKNNYKGNTIDFFDEQSSFEKEELISEIIQRVEPIVPKNVVKESRQTKKHKENMAKIISISVSRDAIDMRNKMIDWANDKGFRFSDTEIYRQGLRRLYEKELIQRGFNEE